MIREHEEIFRDPGVTGLEHVVVRQLVPADLEAVVRIDACLSGRARREYYQRKIADATKESGVRISLAGETDGCFAGFLLGRLYYGEFGVPEPIAIVDSIGVDPAFAHRQVGKALLTQLESNLRGFGIGAIQTQVDWQLHGLLGFLGAQGFEPVPILTLEKKLTP